MFTQAASHNRFNLLLLSEGEQYFNDYAASFYPNVVSDQEAVSRQIKGRLKVCSKSLFFDPEDVSYPIIKYDFSKVIEIDQLKNGLIASVNQGEAFYVRAKQIVQLKENNIIQPYIFLNNEVFHRFSIKYANVKSLLEEVRRLYNISKSPSFEADDKIRRIVEERELKVPFDTTWMESLDERTLLETLSNKITPLVSNAGRLVITNKRLYFQPFNNVAAKPVEKFNLRDCVRIIKRRHELRPLAIEIFFEDSTTSHNDSSVSSVFFTFRDSLTRDRLFETLTNLPGLTNAGHENQSQTTWKWQCGLISNYDYLMYLNSLAHRSFNDFTQYPVFPWVIADYKSKELDLNDPKTFRDLSKPIGALNKERLAAFRRRYNDIPDDQPKFLYGTHYSTPAYVLYYLVRIAPEYMLRLQNGRFDEAERLFNSIGDTWQNVLTNTADLKELIPEFFSSELGGRLGGEFLCNHDDIGFGRRADGSPVGDVELPPWAHSSSSEFVRLNREALESDYVSANLHHWIDLIFGYKQRGEEAIKADNLFHPLTYEGAVDIEKERDPIKRSAILIQINEFGQTPGKIFDEPHPARLSPEERKRAKQSLGNTPTQIPFASARTSSMSGSASSLPPYSPSSQHETVSNMSGSASSLPGYTEPQSSRSMSSSASSLPSYNPYNDKSTISTNVYGSNSQNYSSQLFSPKSSQPVRSFGTPIRDSPQSYPRSIPSSRLETIDTIPMTTGMTPDPHIEQLLGQFAQLSASPAIEQLSAKDIPAAESLNVLLSRNVVADTSASSSVLPIPSTDEWASISRLAPTSTWKSHRQGVTSICLSSDNQILYSVSEDSSLKIYSLAENKQLRSTNISQLSLSSCALSKDQKYVAIGSWDNNIYIYSNDYGRVISTSAAHDDTVSCLCWRENYLLSGSWDTSMKVWTVLPTGIQNYPLVELSCLDSAIRTVHMNLDMSLALCGSEDGMLAIADIRSGTVVRTWSAHDDAISAAQFTSDGRIISSSIAGTLKVQESRTFQDIFSVSVDAPINCFVTNGTRLLSGDANSTLVSWDLLIGEKIGQVQKTPASAITCIVPSENCDFVLTGSEDGSLTKWTKQ